LKIRLYAQYLGENLSEAPAAPLVKRKTRRPLHLSPANIFPTLSTPAMAPRGLFSPVVAACFRKEIQYLKRSGPMLYSFVTPVFMVLVFSAQQTRPAPDGPSGFSTFGHDKIFTIGCAYLQLFMVALVYNSFGADGAGMQLYFYAPVRIRDVVLGKNLTSTLVLLMELVLIYFVVCLTAGVPAAGLKKISTRMHRHNSPCVFPSVTTGWGN
jgi:ABC-2 type transport system permease protein